MKKLQNLFVTVLGTMAKQFMAFFLVGMLALTVTSCDSKDDEIMEPNQNPTVALTVAVMESSISGSIDANDADGTISERMVYLMQGTTEVDALSISGNTFEFEPVANGNYTVRATVMDNDGATGTASKQALVNASTDTFTYTFNQTVNSIDENNTASVVIGMVNKTGTLDFTLSEFTAGGNAFELVGNNVQRKPGADYEDSTNDSFTLVLKVSGHPDVTLSGSVGINDVDESTSYSFCGGHGDVILVEDDNGTLYLADENGNATSTTFASFAAGLPAWSEAGGNLGALAANLDINSGGNPLFTAFGLDVQSQGIIRPGGGSDNSITVPNLGKILEALKTSFSFAYQDSNDYLGANASSPSRARWRLVFFYVAENIAKENTMGALNSNEVMAQIVLDVIQAMRHANGSEVSESEALALINTYYNDASSHPGGITSANGFNCN